MSDVSELESLRKMKEAAEDISPYREIGNQIMKCLEAIDKMVTKAEAE